MTSRPRSLPSFCGVAVCLLWLSSFAFAQNTTESIQQRWEKEIRPIFSTHCLNCHNAVKQSGQLNLESIQGLVGNSLSGAVFDPQNSSESLLLKVLAANAESHMPPKGQLADGDIAVLASFLNDLSTIADRSVWQAGSSKTSRATTSNSETYPAHVPAHLVIDLEIAKRWGENGITPASRTNDAQFARRLYLDLIGRIPTTTELEQFLASTDSAKRDVLIDTLLTSPEHALHLSELLTALFLGRKDVGPIRQAKKVGWYDYLQTAIQNDRPWNEVSAEILLARPTDKAQEGAIWYLYSRKNNHQEIAEAVSRDFFGVRIDCAQCHDHPLANEILQKHYWGLAAFFNRSTNVDTPKGPRIAESAIGGFSEFANIRGSSAPNELVFLGTNVVAEMRPAKDSKEEDREEFYTPGNDGEPKIPKFSRRQQFVEQVLPGHPLLAQAMVNRMWGHMLGRGLVHPVDAMDSFHPASHPELLQWLSRDFERSGYRLRHLLRNIARSQTYQLSVSESAPQDPALFASAIAKPLTAEAFYRSLDFVLKLKNQEEFLSLENRVAFANLFPDVLVEESFANVSQGLMLTNSELMNKFVSVEESAWLADLASQTDIAKMIENLFLTTMHRTPDEEEKQRCQEYLSNSSRPRAKLIEDLAWALLTSSEFRFNH